MRTSSRITSILAIRRSRRRKIPAIRRFVWAFRNFKPRRRSLTTLCNRGSYETLLLRFRIWFLKCSNLTVEQGFRKDWDWTKFILRRFRQYLRRFDGSLPPSLQKFYCQNHCHRRRMLKAANNGTEQPLQHRSIQTVWFQSFDRCRSEQICTRVNGNHISSLALHGFQTLDWKINVPRWCQIQQRCILINFRYTGGKELTVWPVVFHNNTKLSLQRLIGNPTRFKFNYFVDKRLEDIHNIFYQQRLSSYPQ